MYTPTASAGLIAMIATPLLFAVTAVQAGPTPEQQCQATKNKIAGKYAACRQNAEAKLAASGETSKYTDALDKCDTKFSAAWRAADAKAANAGATCLDGPIGEIAFEAAIAAHTDTVATALAGGGLAICGN